MYFCYVLIGQQATLRAADAEAARLEAEIAAAEENKAVVKDLDAISQSDAYIEKVAREKLGLVLPDETVFVDVTGQ